MFNFGGSSTTNAAATSSNPPAFSFGQQQPTSQFGSSALPAGGASSQGAFSFGNSAGFGAGASGDGSLKTQGSFGMPQSNQAIGGAAQQQPSFSFGGGGIGSGGIGNGGIGSGGIGSGGIGSGGIGSGGIGSGGGLFNLNATAAKPASTGLFSFGGASGQQPSMMQSSLQPSLASSLQSSLQPTLLQQQPQVSTLASHPLQYIQQCYDPSNPNYRFRAFFYNTLPSGEDASKYASMKKPDNISDRMWTQVIHDNPNPTRMVPVLANGFGDLSARATWQDEQQAAQAAKLSELDQRISTMLKMQDLDVHSQLQEAYRRQLCLCHRVLKIMRMMEGMRKAGCKLSPAEEAIAERLKLSLGRISQPPIDPASMRGMGFQLHSMLESGRIDPYLSARQLKISDEDALSRVFSILEEQQTGLKQLVEMVNKDCRDVEIMRSGYKSV